MYITFWIQLLTTGRICSCLAFFLASKKQGGSCSCSRSILRNSSIVRRLEGVSLKSPSLYNDVEQRVKSLGTIVMVIEHIPFSDSTFGEFYNSSYLLY